MAVAIEYVTRCNIKSVTNSRTSTSMPLQPVEFVGHVFNVPEITIKYDQVALQVFSAAC